MLLESIKLENFRQFRNESIDFAQGQNGKMLPSLLVRMEQEKRRLRKLFLVYVRRNGVLR